MAGSAIAATQASTSPAVSRRMAATKVSIKVGDKGANGTGHLSGRTGAGVWRGVGANGSCAGRWEAELE